MAGRRISSPAEERLVLELIKLSDEKAFKRLFDCYYKPLCKYARLLVGNADDAEDIVIQLFVNLWENRMSLVVRDSLRPYLFRAVKNRCLNFLRDNPGAASGLDEILGVADGSGADDGLHAQDIENFISEALMQLPSESREAFTMSRQHEQSYKDIARSQGVSVKTVESRMSRALKALRAKLI